MQYLQAIITLWEIFKEVKTLLKSSMGDDYLIQLVKMRENFSIINSNEKTNEEKDAAYRAISGMFQRKL